MREKLRQKRHPSRSPGFALAPRSLCGDQLPTRARGHAADGWITSSAENAAVQGSVDQHGRLPDSRKRSGIRQPCGYLSFARRLTGSCVIDGLASLRVGLPPLHLRLPAADGAPVLVIGHGHAAFNADPHALRGLRGVRREEALQKRHSEAPGYIDQMLSYGTRGDRVTPIPANPPTRLRHSLDPRIRQKVGTSRTTTDTSGPTARARGVPLDIREERPLPKPNEQVLQGTLDLLIPKTLSLAPMRGWGLTHRIEQLSKDALQVGQGSI